MSAKRFAAIVASLRLNKDDQKWFPLWIFKFALLCGDPCGCEIGVFGKHCKDPQFKGLALIILRNF